MPMVKALDKNPFLRFKASPKKIIKNQRTKNNRKTNMHQYFNNEKKRKPRAHKNMKNYIITRSFQKHTSYLWDFLFSNKPPYIFPKKEK